MALEARALKSGAMSHVSESAPVPFLRHVAALDDLGAAGHVEQSLHILRLLSGNFDCVVGVVITSPRPTSALRSSWIRTHRKEQAEFSSDRFACADPATHFAERDQMRSSKHQEFYAQCHLADLS